MTLNRKQFQSIMGERFKTRHHPDLENAWENAEGHLWNNSIAYLSEDNYGIQARGTGGPRSVFSPDGENIEDAQDNKHAVQIIREHRNRTK